MNYSSSLLIRTGVWHEGFVGHTTELEVTWAVTCTLHVRTWRLKPVETGFAWWNCQLAKGNGINGI